MRLVSSLAALGLALGAAALSAQSPGPSPAFKRWVVDRAASMASFAGKSTLHDFTGTTRALEGEIRCDPDHLVETLGGSFAFAVSSLDTADKGRDEEMRKRLAADQFPSISFTLDALEKAPVGVVAVGRFAVRGVERLRRISGSLDPVEGGAFRARGETVFKMTDHKIEPPVVAIITVDDEVCVKADIVLCPAVDEAVEARAFRIDVREIEEPLGGERKEKTRSERLWVAKDGALWTRDAAPVFVQESSGALRLVDLRRAETSPLPAGCDAAFRAGAESLVGLKKKIDALPEARRAALAAKLAESIARLERAASLAPPAGEAVVVKSAGRVVVRLGDVDWATFEGLSGDEPMPRLLLALDGLPLAVRTALSRLSGIPKTAIVRCVGTAGARTLRYEFSAPEIGTCPRRLLDSTAWTKAREEVLAW